MTKREALYSVSRVAIVTAVLVAAWTHTDPTSGWRYFWCFYFGGAYMEMVTDLQQWLKDRPKGYLDRMLSNVDGLRED